MECTPSLAGYRSKPNLSQPVHDLYLPTTLSKRPLCMSGSSAKVKFT